MKEESDSQAVEKIGNATLVVHGKRVLLDSDLAALYGVTTKALNQAVRRNAERFPADFMFRLDINEIPHMWSQSVTTSASRRRRTHAPYAFTEHGAIMAATLLNSGRAIEMSLYVVRAFVRMREVLLSDRVLASRLAALERSLTSLDANTRRQFKEVYDARSRHNAAERRLPTGAGCA